jgi:D-alanyl-D-alanine carboxypeptidase
MYKLFITTIALLVTSVTYASAVQQTDFDDQVQQALAAHFKHYKDMEYFSGAAVSIYIPQQSIKNYYIGHVSHDLKSPLVSNKTLFQIGSITQSFTAAIVLRLEKAEKLKLTDSLQQWLPQYKKWPGLSIIQLLNMTSGLPNYADMPLLNAQLYYNPSRVWTNQELINFAYPQGKFLPPLKSGYFYTNTGYVLAALIVEKAGKTTFDSEINRIIRLADLKNTTYVLQEPPPAMHAWLAHGYSYNQYDNAANVGRDIYDSNLSWAAAAGGLIANSEDIVKWVKALFMDNKILDQTLKNKLMSLISVADGKPLRQVTEDNPRAFGLGVAQNFDAVSGRYWFYEGKTLGFRALYLYQPCNGVIISAVFNSATHDENDHAGLLIQRIYQLINAQYPQLRCAGVKL